MFSTNELIDFIRFIVGVLVLTYASYTDIKTRRASNMLWVIMGGIGVLLLLFQYFMLDGFGDQILYLIFIPVMIGMMYILFQVGFIFGGADAKAIMALAILVPFTHSFSLFPFWASPLPFSWIVFLNSLLLSLIIPLGLMIYNIYTRDLVFPHCFLGYKMDINKAKEKFVWPLEKIVNGKRKMVYMSHSFDAADDWKKFEQLGINRVWVTPKIPFMIPLLAGFICAFLFGDILFLFVHAIW